MRGIRTALLDKGDFGSGTSGRSSRLIHGGLRYLELGDWRLVFEASRERRTLLRIAPHLVWPRAFLFPVHVGGRVPCWKLAAGLWLYDLLALFRNVRPHRMLSKRQLLHAEPALRDRGLRGGARYFDAQCDDARLTLANVRAAHRHGAVVANYLDVEHLDIIDGRVRGARVVDRLSGTRCTVRAVAVVNATGPWSDDVRRGDGGPPALRCTKGAHVAVLRSRLGNHEAITSTSPIDGRVMFIVPWGALTYIGTTDTDTSEAPDEIRASADDVVYLLRSANALYPAARLQPADVVSTWAGLRPLLRADADATPSAVSREHRIIEGPSGLISIVGGKLTTYRVMAQQVVDRVAQRLEELDGQRRPSRAPTDTEPLPGGEVVDPSVIVEEVVQAGTAPAIADHLVRAYGSETHAVLRLAQEQPQLAQPIVAGHPALRAELVHGIRREMAMTLADLLIRRTHVFYEAVGQGVAEAPAVAEIAATELGWDAARQASELAAYFREVERSRSFLMELEGRDISPANPIRSST